MEELLAEMGFRERRIVTIAEAAEATPIHGITLSKVANHPGSNTGTGNLDRLCRYFGCALDALAQ